MHPLLIPVAARWMKNRVSWPFFGKTIVIGLIGLTLLMSFLIYAFARDDANILTILFSTVPVHVLPIFCLVTR